MGHRSRRLGASVAALACALLLAARIGESVAGDASREARIEMSTRSVALGIGYNWGTGTLEVDGTTHTFSVKNVKFGAVGVSTVRAAGTVNRLKQIEDFNGTYVAGEAGLVLGGGASALTMVNQKGVVINLLSVQAGLALTLGPGGMTLELD